MTVMVPQFIFIMNRKLQPDNILRRHSTHHKRKPRLHDGTVMVDADKYRLVEIPLLVVVRKPDVGLTRIW